MIKMERMQLPQLEKSWRKLTSGNTNISPFHEYEFAEKLLKSYRIPQFWKHMPVWIEKPVFYTFYDNGEVILIAPLVRTFSKQGVYYKSFGARFRIVYEDFIYADSLETEKLETCLDLLKQKLGTIRLYFQMPGTKLYNVLVKSGKQINSEIMCKIDLPETYEEYNKALGYRMQRNIRNINNRMQADGCITSLSVYNGNEMPVEEYEQFLSLYEQSLQRKNGSSRFKLKKKINSYIIRSCHPYATTMNTIPSSFCACYRINEEIAAAEGGYVDPCGQYIIVHRVAYNPKFQRYDPGHMMHIELIRYMIEKTNIRVFDLSKGNEPYKYQLGAESFYQYGFEITIVSNNL